MTYLKETGLKQVIISFMLVSACISGAIGILGLIFLPEAKMGYDAFFSPYIFAAVSMLPSAVFHSGKVLSKKQILFRSLLHLVLLEIVILTFAYCMGSLISVSVTIALSISVLVIDIVVTLLMKINGKRTADEFNEALKQMQEEKKELY